MAQDSHGIETRRRGAATVVRPDAWFGDDATLVEAIRTGRPGASQELFARHAPHVQRVLGRILGPDDELADLLQEVFITALGELPKLRDPASLKAWLAQIAVHKARGLIRRRQRRSWLRFGVAAPESHAPSASSEVASAAHAVMRALERMPADLRIAFSLRFIDHMELTDVAQCCGCSLATIKRRIAKAEQRFVALAKADPHLRAVLADSERWSAP